MMRAAAAAAAALAILAMPVHAGTVVLYSSADAECQAPIAALSAVYGPVVDYRTQRPGTLWRSHLARQILQADVVLVLWSAAAAASAELAPELRLAYAAAQRGEQPAALVPILLDATPMPAELATHHAIAWACAYPGARSAP